MSEPSTDDRESFYLFPYMGITKLYQVGPFSLEPLDPAKLAAAKDGLGVTMRSLLALMRDPDGKPLETATLVQRHKPELYSISEREYEREALHAAVSFAVADSNAPHGNAIPWDSTLPSFATSEVAAFKIIQLEALETGRFYRYRGGIHHAKVWIGGSIYNDTDVLEQTPEGLVSIPRLALDEELMQAVHSVVFEGLLDENRVEHRAIQAGLHWHSRAWENGASHSTPDAVVQIKTAIEALSGEHRTARSIPVLEQIYSATEGTLGASEYLWDSAEPKYERIWNNKVSAVSSFAQWYWMLADARNMIVHNTETPTTEYIHDLASPFVGNIFQVGERVTRELIKIRLAQLGHPRAAVSPRLRRMLDRRENHLVGMKFKLITLT
jgi:hypothetical protein